KPEELQKQIDGLYQQAQHAIERNAEAPQSPPRPPYREDYREQRRSNGGGRDDTRYNRGGNGGGNGDRGGSGQRNGGSMTESQRRAILAIGRRGNIDVDYECREIIGEEFDDLSVRQASELIDHLKSITSPGNGRGR